MPTARAELVAQWIEQFAPRAPFHALVVEDGGRWVAALPLVRARRCRLLSTAGLPTNEWSPGGELLLDAEADADAVLDVVMGGIRQLPWPLVWLDYVPLHTRRWQAFQAAAARAAMPSDSHPQWQVPVIEVGRDWEACQQRWSKKHRDKMIKAARRLAEKGCVQFQMQSQLAPEEAESRVRQAFDIEDLGWKGEARTAVLRTAGMLDFFLRQATQLARWGQLELALLKLDDRPISFVYGLAAKGVSHWLKIGYDPEYRCSTPGQLLQYHMLKRFHEEGDRLAIDCVGPLTDALSKWKPTTYTMGRLIIAPRRWSGRAALYACKHWWPTVRRWLGRNKIDGPAETQCPQTPSEAGERSPALA